MPRATRTRCDRCSPTTCSTASPARSISVETQGQSLETQLISIRGADVVEAGMQGTNARIAIRFTSEQVNVVRDADGNALDGDPGTAEEVVDVWTFERDTASSDPNWILVETRTPQ